MTEKEAMELAAVEAFLSSYNKLMGASYGVNGRGKPGEQADFYCIDSDLCELWIEVTHTEDHRGKDIVSLLGRSDFRDELPEHPSCLQGNVRHNLIEIIQEKVRKAYASKSNTALVIRSASGVPWTWEWIVEDVRNTLGLPNGTYDRGIWILSHVENRIVRVDKDELET
jgi:hypothetical protein